MVLSDRSLVFNLQRLVNRSYGVKRGYPTNPISTGSPLSIEFDVRIDDVRARHGFNLGVEAE